MSDFWTESTVKAVRKPHRCEDCRKLIEVGSPASHTAGVYDGDFFSNYSHVECRAAALDYHCVADLTSDEWPWLHELDEVEDWKWLIAEHPIVAERMGLQKRIAEREAA
jgi:hypothetical protein